MRRCSAVNTPCKRKLVPLVSLSHINLFLENVVLPHDIGLLVRRPVELLVESANPGSVHVFDYYVLHDNNTSDVAR